MFSRPEQLAKRTGRKGVARFDFLQQLVAEFQDSDSAEAKEQVLANLANFAYDPINYEFLRQLKVIDLFLDQLSEDDPRIARCAVAGLCNLCLDPENKEYILGAGGVSLLVRCLSRTDEETVLDAITALMYLVTPQFKPEITSAQMVDCMVRVSRSRNARLSNLATVFLEDYCQVHQVESVRGAALVASIPLPPPRGAQP
ncbi:armadillo repeat-containing protein 7-like isoform X2 [Bacillus rossius redtenbacheri]